MFKNLQPLSTKTHSHLQLKQHGNFLFAKGVAAIPLGVGEIKEASKYYPVVFSNEDISSPVALVGVQGHNNYVSETGQWLAPYIPAKIRTYPFTLIRTDKADQFVIAADMDAPHFVEEGGNPLFLEEGKNAPWLGEIVQMLMALDKECLEGQAIAEEFKKAELIADRRIDLTLPDGSIKCFQGFLVFDEDKFSKLTKKKLKEMETNGMLDILNAHRASLTNFSRLVPATSSTS